MGRGSEKERIALLERRLAPGARADVVRVGIGDDAAVLERIDGPLVWTVDAQVEGTHFRSDWVSWEDVGWRSFMAAASDLAAMGAEPVAALSALTLAPSLEDDALDMLARGQADAARLVGAPIVGGNLARAPVTSVTTTLLGRAEAPVSRRGARPGEHVYAAGDLGLAAAGLAALSAGVAEHEDLAPCLAAWRRPVARIADGLAMRAYASAAVDVSDGLAGDLAHVAEASGVTIALDEDALRARARGALERASGLLGRDPLDFVLHGGEDYALIAVCAAPPPGFARIGAIEPRDGGGALVVLASAEGRRAVPPRGFDHFA